MATADRSCDRRPDRFAQPLARHAGAALRSFITSDGPSLDLTSRVTARAWVNGPVPRARHLVASDSPPPRVQAMPELSTAQSCWTCSLGEKIQPRLRVTK